MDPTKKYKLVATERKGAFFDVVLYSEGKVCEQRTSPAGFFNDYLTQTMSGLNEVEINYFTAPLPQGIVDQIQSRGSGMIFTQSKIQLLPAQPPPHPAKPAGPAKPRARGRK